MARQLAALEAGRGEVGNRLEVLSCVFATCPDMVSSEQVTEVCSDLLSSMSRSEESGLLPGSHRLGHCTKLSTV